MKNFKKEKRIRRHKRVRAKVKGTAERPRLSVFRSNKHIWAQLVDDQTARTITAANDTEFKDKGKKTTHQNKFGTGQAKDKISVKGEKVGELLAKKASEKKVGRVVFDRGGYKFHGIVKAVAEGARKGGLKL